MAWSDPYWTVLYSSCMHAHNTLHMHTHPCHGHLSPHTHTHTHTSRTHARTHARTHTPVLSCLKTAISVTCPSLEGAENEKHYRSFRALVSALLARLSALVDSMATLAAAEALLADNTLYGTHLLFNRFCPLCHTLVSLQITRPAEPPATLSTYYLLLWVWVVSLVGGILMLSATSVHRKASSIYTLEPSSTDSASHCSHPFMHWPLALRHALVIPLVTFSPEASATHVTLDKPEACPSPVAAKFVGSRSSLHYTPRTTSLCGEPLHDSCLPVSIQPSDPSSRGLSTFFLVLHVGVFWAAS